MPGDGGSDRALSPVVGTALLIAIVLLFSVVAGYVFFGLSDTSDPAPQVVWETDSSDDIADWRLVHRGGDRVAGDRLELRGTASPDAARGVNLSTGDEVSFYPTASEVEVIWYDGDETSYRLTAIEVEQPLPEPDEGCDWVESETEGGNESIEVDGEVVNCDVGTDEDVNVVNGGAVVGEVVSGNKVLDVDVGTVYGDVDVSGVANVQDGAVTGSITSDDEEVKVYNTTVGDRIDAEDEAEVLDGSRAEDDVVSRTGTAQVTRSTVEGSVTGDGGVKLEHATIEGHVYAAPADFDCSNSTIAGEDCGTYAPRDPDDW